MADNPLVAAPLTHVATELLPPVEQSPGIVLPPPTVEQMQTADTVFNQDSESDNAAALMGLWTGILLLHDVAADTFQKPRQEEEKESEERSKDEG